MRIIAGLARGRNLKTPKGMATRPTQDRVRESIFNVLMNYGFSGATVLDLFAGTGALGLEALSRGAVELVAMDQRTGKLIKENATLCGFEKAITVVPLSLQSGANYLEGRAFDYIFSDPPYEKNLIQASIDVIYSKACLKKDGLLILEHHKDEEFTLPSQWECFKTKDFDYTRISYISWSPVERS